MDYKQILEVLKAEVSNVEQFAYHFEGYYPEKFTEEQELVQKLKDDFYNSFKDLPRDSEEFKEKSKQFLLMPTKYQVATEDYAKSLGLGPIEEVAQFGGEGMGDTWYSVKYFPDHDVYIRVDGHYSSYNGVDFYRKWNCCSEVRPVEKTITVYEG